MEPWSMSLTPQQTQVQGVNGTMHLTPKQTQIQGVNGTMDFITSNWLGVNGTMDLITSTGSKSDHGFDPKTDTSTGCKWNHGA